MKSEQKGAIQFYFSELPDYLEFYLFENGTSQKVEIHSKYHVKKVCLMPHSWSLDFPFNRLRSDVFAYTIKAYGLTLQPTAYR